MGQGSGSNKSVTLFNPIDNPRIQEVAVFTRIQLLPFLPKGVDRPNWKIDGKDVLQQYDDLDSDGKWDELSLLVPKLGGQARVVLSTSKEKKSNTLSLTHARFAKSIKRNEEFRPINSDLRHNKSFADEGTPQLYQIGGPAIENYQVGFRRSFDSRNQVGILGKTKPKLMLDSLGVGNDYTELSDWGMEVLNIDNSIGAGGLALYPFASDGSSSVQRIKTADSVKCHVIAKGPIRAILRFDYYGVTITSGKVNVTEWISLAANNFHYSSKVRITNPKGSLPSIGLATGIKSTRNNVIFDADWLNGFHLLANHDLMTQDGSRLGMAILFDQKCYRKSFKFSDDGEFHNSELVALISDDGSYRFNFYAGWSDSDFRFKDWQSWLKFLELESEKLVNPISIQVK